MPRLASEAKRARFSERAAELHDSLLPFSASSGAAETPHEPTLRAYSAPDAGEEQDEVDEDDASVSSQDILGPSQVRSGNLYRAYASQDLPDQEEEVASTDGGEGEGEAETEANVAPSAENDESATEADAAAAANEEEEDDFSDTRPPYYMKGRGYRILGPWPPGLPLDDDFALREWLDSFTIGWSPEPTGSQATFRREQTGSHATFRPHPASSARMVRFEVTNAADETGEMEA